MRSVTPALRALLAVGCAALAGTASGNDRMSGDVVPDGPPVISVSKAADGLGAPIVLRENIQRNPAAAGRATVADIPRGLPVAARALTSSFGMRSHPILGGVRMHSGVDLAAPAGSPVESPAAGVVQFANWAGGYGLLVTVDHGNGVQTRFGHLSRIMVWPGEAVSRGQLLGLVGSTGRSTGPHLHYEVRHAGVAVNPLAAR